MSHAGGHAQIPFFLKSCPVVVRQLWWAERHQEHGWQLCLLSKEPLSKECLSCQESYTLCQADSIPVFSPTELQIKHTQTPFLYNYIILEKTENNTSYSIKKPWFCWIFCVPYSIRGQEAREAEAVPWTHTAPHYTGSIHLPTEIRRHLELLGPKDRRRPGLPGNMHAWGKW